ncbi:MAG: hypothetical protein QXH92_03920 [Candidatus Aenigmatarchaeota archaeon]
MLFSNSITICKLKITKKQKFPGIKIQEHCKELVQTVTKNFFSFFSPIVTFPNGNNVLNHDLGLDTIKKVAIYHEHLRYMNNFDELEQAVGYSIAKLVYAITPIQSLPLHERYFGNYIVKFTNAPPALKVLKLFDIQLEYPKYEEFFKTTNTNNIMQQTINSVVNWHLESVLSLKLMESQFFNSDMIELKNSLLDKLIKIERLHFRKKNIFDSALCYYSYFKE